MTGSPTRRPAAKAPSCSSTPPGTRSPDTRVTGRACSTCASLVTSRQEVATAHSRRARHVAERRRARAVIGACRRHPYRSVGAVLRDVACPRRGRWRRARPQAGRHRDKPRPCGVPPCEAAHRNCPDRSPAMTLVRLSGTRITNVFGSCRPTTKRLWTYQAGRDSVPLRLTSGSDSAYSAYLFWGHPRSVAPCLPDPSDAAGLPRARPSHASPRRQPTAGGAAGVAALCSRMRVSVQRKWRWAISMRAANVSRQSSALVITATAVLDAGQANEKQL